MFHKIDILLIREYYDYGFWLQSYEYLVYFADYW